MSISRRSFLKGAAAASLAVAASGILTGCSGITGGLTGGAYISGSKTGSFAVADGKSITVNATGVEYVSVYDELVPTLQIVNKSGYDVKVVKSATANGAYNLVPSIKYVGTSGQTLTVDFTRSTLDDAAVATDKDATGTLVIPMKALTEAESNWTAVELTLTVYNGITPMSDIAPVTFTFKK